METSFKRTLLMMILVTTATATLLDIPLSISSPPSLRLRSSTPPTTPFTAPTPNEASSHEIHHHLLQPITIALSSLPPDTVYHLPRCTLPPPLGEVDFHANTSLLASSCEVIELQEVVDDISDIYGAPVYNTCNEWTSLTILHPVPKKRFLVPPRSSFFLGPLPSSSFAEVLGKRDFVLLDPPWPNASAKRNRAGYKTETRFSIMPLLFGLPLDDVVNDGGVVGLWITNKPSIRRQLGSLFAAWGVEEVTEWVWVKTTTSGEPVVALDSKGRRPYEVLVLARKVGGPEIPGKVIVGVPDLHSRKPGVKGMYYVSERNR